MVFWLERDADLHIAQLMPLPLTVTLRFEQRPSKKTSINNNKLAVIIQIIDRNRRDVHFFTQLVFSRLRENCHFIFYRIVLLPRDAMHPRY